MEHSISSNIYICISRYLDALLRLELDICLPQVGQTDRIS